MSSPRSPARDPASNTVAESRRQTAARLLGPAADGAALAVLVWAAANVLGLPDIVGIALPSPVIVALLVGAVLGAAGAGRLVRIAAGLMVLLLVLVTSLPVTAMLAQPLVRRDRPAADSGAVVDAVAVLSGSVGTDGLIQRQALDRLLDGLALAQRTGLPIVVSVVRETHRPSLSSLADQERLAALAGVADRLVTVDSVHNTHDEAVRMAAVARAHGWRRVALVTSPTHSRRACATFERAGLAVVCSPSRARDAAWGGPQPLRTPTDRLHVTASWLYETLGWLVYRAHGWV